MSSPRLRIAGTALLTAAALVGVSPLGNQRRVQVSVDWKGGGGPPYIS